jgi:hypothetical protein
VDPFQTDCFSEGQIGPEIEARNSDRDTTEQNGTVNLHGSPVNAWTVACKRLGQAGCGVRATQQ